MKRSNAARFGEIGFWILELLAVCLLAGLAAPAKADLRVLDFETNVSLQIWTLPSGTAPGGASGAAITYGGHLSTLAIPGGAFGPITASVPVTNNVTINSVIFTGVGNLPATVAGISGGPPLGSGAMGMQGSAKVCLVFAACAYSGITVPLTPSGANGFGIGGTQILLSAYPYLTMQHAPWTVGQPTMTIHTPGSTVTTPALPGGFAHGPASLTSSTARFSGVVQLVTASKVYTSLTGAFPEVPMIGILELHIVPEPGTLLLLGSGVAVLASLGRRRRRR